MSTPTTQSDPASPFKLLPGRTYSFEHVFNREHPEPDLAEDPTPLPPLPPPCFAFDPDALTLAIHLDGEDLTLDLAGIADNKSPIDFKEKRSPSAQWWTTHGVELRDEIENAAWEVFCGGTRFFRALAFEQTPPDFDVWEVLKSGAKLDWTLGTVALPGEHRSSGRAVSLFELTDNGEEAPELIQARYLCRGGAWLINGPTGVGKSSLVSQLAIAFGLGKPCLGFEPEGPLSTLIVQAENDAGDLAEQRDGIVEGMGLSEDEQYQAKHMVGVVTLDDATGKDFFVRLEKLLRQWKPDILILDPLLAFIGADISKQEVASDFLRRRLNPILHRLRIGCIVVHHTGKPPRDGKDGPHQDYSGIGSSELSNWARAIADLRVEGDAFSLTLGKRGKRAGITDSYGFPRIWLRHAENVIYWETCDPATVASPKKPKTTDDMLAQVPISPARILKASLIEKAKAAEIGENRARAFLDELIDAGKLHLHQEKRAGTRPRLYVARHPQPTQAELPQ